MMPFTSLMKSRIMLSLIEPDVSNAITMSTVSMKSWLGMSIPSKAQERRERR